MSPLFGKIVLFVGLVLTIVIRVPHEKRSREVKIAESRKSGLEKALLALVGVGVMLLPIIFIFTPILDFANYEMTWPAFIVGLFSLAGNLWLFARSHRDLGANWSPTLEIREGHRLMTGGVYRHVRHPMYTSIFLYVIAQACLLSNAVAGPAGLVAFGLMYLLRVGREEQMMIEKFGDEYRTYMSQTGRLVPRFV